MCRIMQCHANFIYSLYIQFQFFFTVPQQTSPSLIKMSSSLCISRQPGRKLTFVAQYNLSKVCTLIGQCSIDYFPIGIWCCWILPSVHRCATQRKEFNSFFYFFSIFLLFSAKEFEKLNIWKASLYNIERFWSVHRVIKNSVSASSWNSEKLVNATWYTIKLWMHLRVYDSFVFNNLLHASITLAPGGEGRIRISSDRDDQRIFLGWKFFIPGFFGYENQASIFFWVAWFE